MLKKEQLHKANILVLASNPLEKPLKTFYFAILLKNLFSTIIYGGVPSGKFLVL